MENGADLVLTDLPRVLLEASVLLSGAVLVGVLIRRVSVPLTAVLAVIGLLVKESGVDLAIIDLIEGAGFEDLVLNLFLPILIFEAALMLSTREFMRNIVPIGALATVALVISAVFVAFSLFFAWSPLNLDPLHSLNLPLVPMTFTVALLFGVIVSATDPVAVVAVFREVGVSNRLLTLVEGESLLNDGVAIVLSQILIVAATGGASLSLYGGASDFVTVFFGGIAIGAVIGTVAVLLLPLLGRLPAAALSIALAYGGFVLADEVLGASGVMATVAAGVIVGSMTESRAGMDVREMLHEFWDALAFMANALLFLFVGLALSFDLIQDNLAAIGVGIAAVLVARPVAVVPVIWLLEKMRLVVRVGRRNSAVVVWGGLRGGVALALALSLPETVAHQQTIIAMTGGIVLATLLVNATTIRFLVHTLGLDKTSRTDQFLSAAARLFAIDATRRRLKELQVEDGVVEAHLTAAEVTSRDDLTRSHLTAAEELAVLTLRGLHIERETYQSLSDAGLLPPIATRTLMYEIDDEIEEASAGSLRVEAARRAHLPWYALAHRRLLGWLPSPLGEDLLEVAYIEVSARRLASQKAAAGLEQFSSLPNIDEEKVRLAQRTFTDWEKSATRVLEKLDQQDDVDRALLHRRQAQALSRITVREVLFDLVSSGVLGASAAEDAAARIDREIGGPT